MKGDRLGSVALALMVAVSAPLPGVEPGPPPWVRSARAHDVTEAEISAYARRYRISPVLARTIYVQARDVGVEPGLAFGLAATESRFNPRAVGRQGERGLLQLKLTTARVYDRHLKAEELFHPETNVRIGLLHLKREVEHFDHDWRLGLLAYNMGRGRLERALDRGRVPRTRYAGRVLAHLDGPPL
jgi:soluble lytic murein transglycosylase-like protein